MSWLDNLIGLGGYKTIQGNGVAVTRRETLNLVGVGVTVADNAAQNRTDATLTANLVWAVVSSLGFYFVPEIENPTVGVTAVTGDGSNTGTSLTISAQSVGTGEVGEILEGTAGGQTNLVGAKGGAEGGDVYIAGGDAELDNRKTGNVTIESGYYSGVDGSPIIPTTDSTGGDITLNLRTTSIDNPGQIRVRVDGNDRIVVDVSAVQIGAGAAVDILSDVATGKLYRWSINGVRQLQLSSTGLEFGETTDPFIGQESPSDDSPTHWLWIEAQHPYIGATGTNRDVQGIKLVVPLANAGGAEGVLETYTNTIKLYTAAETLAATLDTSAAGELEISATAKVTVGTTAAAELILNQESAQLNGPDTLSLLGGSEASLRADGVFMESLTQDVNLTAASGKGIRTTGRTYGADHTLANSDATINVSTGSNWELATPTANRTTRLGSTGATGKDGIALRFARVDTAAFTWTFLDDGTSNTVYVFASATPGKIVVRWDDVNGLWVFDEQELTP